MDAVEFIAALVGEEHAYRIGERVHVRLGGGWSIAVSADDAGRLRVEGCFRGAPRCTLWTDARDRSRLAELAREVQALAGAEEVRTG